MRLALLALFALTACRTTAGVIPDPPAAPVTPAPSVQPFRQPAPARALRPVTPPVCDFQPVFFEFNSDRLNPLTEAQLTALSRCLSQSLTLAGHADERGTEEYNLLLSQRRAEMVRRYLIAAGVEHSLAVIGYGESQPAALGSNDAAWMRNRRVELVR